MSQAPSDASAKLAQTPLHTLHVELGARMGAFAGYDMPIQFPSGVKAEHLHTRSACGLFDVSHMGQLRVIGGGKGATLESVGTTLSKALPIEPADWPLMQQRYSLLLNENGGIEDDLMIVRLYDEFRLIVNAANCARDLELLTKHCPKLRFDRLDAALLALQGPLAEAVLSTLDPKAAKLSFMHGGVLLLDGVPCFTTRSGYTGEDGYEISIPIGAAERIARKLLDDVRVAPIGLGARDSLRLEAGLPLHGHDIGPTTTPLEAGAGWAIAPSRRAGGAREGGFPGAAKVIEQFANGVKRRLIGLKSNEAVPVRSGCELLNATGKKVGAVTSGTLSPTLNQPIMLAIVESNALAPGDGETLFHAVVRDKRPPVFRCRLPFVPKQYKR
jgi:aminomethyltransferase